MKTLLLTYLAWSLLVLPPSQAGDLVPGYWEQTSLPQTGLATFYAPGMMEYVRAYRESRGQLPDCPECVGTVALLRAGDIGRKVWLQPPGGERVGPFLVIDCARREDVAPLVSRNWAVDVSYELGQAWGMRAPLSGVTVLEDPADAVAGRTLPRGIPTPFYVAPSEVVISAPSATPEFTPAAPAPWPTRVPVGLQPYAAAPTSVAVPTLPVPHLLPPLTPMVTTPTPAVTAAPAATASSGGSAGAGAGLLTPAPAETAALAPTSLPEVAVGRAGGGLLEPESALTPPPSFWTTPVPTPRPPARTPRPDLTPILAPGASPSAEILTPTAEPQESPLIRFWRNVIERVLP